MIFMHKMAAVLDGTKTQTRRARRAGDRLCEHNGDKCVVGDKCGVRWKVGRTLAICSGRGIKAEPGVRILITDLRLDKQPLMISLRDAIAEGFGSRIEFKDAWKSLQGKLCLKPCWVVEFKLVRTPAGVLS
jgi:hypothetical protein